MHGARNLQLIWIELNQVAYLIQLSKIKDNHTWRYLTWIVSFTKNIHTTRTPRICVKAKQECAIKCIQRKCTRTVLLSMSQKMAAITTAHISTNQLCMPFYYNKFWFKTLIAILMFCYLGFVVETSKIWKLARGKLTARVTKIKSGKRKTQLPKGAVLHQNQVIP